MRRSHLILSALAIAAGTAGWALFRPEKLFINETVSEAAVEGAKTVAEGKFASYAHETLGTASIVTSGGKRTLRLSGFSTSNGPDVHVYLVKGNDPNKVTEGSFLDLGVIKGNQGDQNYDVPEGSEAYGSVNIWCKRFSVGFGGATLTPKLAANNDGFRTVAFEATVVTQGKLGTGIAALVESTGKRELVLTGVRGAKNLRVLLLKSENPPKGDMVAKTEKLDLGTLAGSPTRLAVPKAVDAWLFRSVILWNPVTKKVVSAGVLRSDQEKKRAFSLV